MQLVPDIVEEGDDLCVGLGLEVAVGVRGRRDGRQLGVQRGLRPRSGWKGFISDQIVLLPRSYRGKRMKKS